MVTPSPRCDSDTPSTSRCRPKIDTRRRTNFRTGRHFYAVRVKWLRFPRVVGVIVVVYFLVVTGLLRVRDGASRVSSSRTPRPVNGIVVALEPRPIAGSTRVQASGTDIPLAPQVRYVVGGQTYLYTASHGVVGSELKVGDAIEVLYDPSQSRTGPPSRRGPDPAAAHHGRVRDGGGGPQRRLDPHPEPRIRLRSRSTDALRRARAESSRPHRRRAASERTPDPRVVPTWAGHRFVAWQTSSRSIPGRLPGGRHSR